MPSSKASQPVYEPFHKVLQELDRLERSLPTFPRQLTSLLSGGDYSFIASLPDKDAAWLIEYLDNVRARVPLYPLYTEPAQALETIDPVDVAYRRCLGVLQMTCYIKERLPRSYIFDVSSFVPIASPTATGPYETIYEGSIDGSKVFAKRLDLSLSSNWWYVKKVLG
jgi:hypothetical protein